MPKTLVTVDFDGVISPIDHDRDFTLEEGWKQFYFSFPCDVHESTLELLHELKKRDTLDELDLFWNSSWSSGTQTFSPKSDGAIPSFDYLRLDSGLEKPKVLLEKLKEGSYTRLVVLEDSSGIMGKIKAKTKLLPELETLFIKPKLEVGLTPTHIQKILNFLNADVEPRQPDAL